MDDALPKCVPVVHNKHNHLCKGKEQLCQVWDGLIPVVHPWKVDHIKSLHTVIQVVEERYSGALYGSCTYGNLNEIMSTVNVSITS